MRIGLAQFAIFFRRQIYQDRSVDTGRMSRLGKLNISHTEHRIGISHDNDRRCLVLGAKPGRQRQRVSELCFIGERAQARLLNGCPIGHRVGKGRAKLNDIGAVVAQRAHGSIARLKVRVAGHKVGNQNGAGFAACAREGVCNAGSWHQVSVFS